MAENNGKIYITITDERGNGGGKPDKPKEEKEKKSQSQIFADYAKHEFFNFVKAQSQQFMNYTLGNIGNFTGSYQSQRNTADTLKIANMLKSVGLSTLAGFKYAGVGGAIVGAIISVGSIATNTYLEARSYNFEIEKQNNAIREMRILSGLDALTNNSRSG